MQVLRYFNTSHVSINRLIASKYSWFTKISIHLMFLLIVLKSSFATCSLHFNTSHVSINRTIHNIQNIRKAISIHLMFLLILCLFDHCPRFLFISIHLMFLLIFPRSVERKQRRTFQYISCFY